uniref:Uncharacterized protein n=1 Tax=Graphocephala atropunctata TaxID=36148 RepID=A0A1B6M7L7_9HEMI
MTFSMYLGRLLCLTSLMLCGQVGCIMQPLPDKNENPLNFTNNERLTSDHQQSQRESLSNKKASEVTDDSSKTFPVYDTNLFWQNIQRQRKEEDKKREEEDRKKEEEDRKREQEDRKRIQSDVTTVPVDKKRKADKTKLENESHFTDVPTTTTGKLKTSAIQFPHNNNRQEAKRVDQSVGSEPATISSDIVKERKSKYSQTTGKPIRFEEKHSGEGFQNDQLIHFANHPPTETETPEEKKMQTDVNASQSSAVADTQPVKKGSSSCGQTECSTAKSSEHCYGKYCTHVVLLASSVYWYHLFRAM